MREFLARQRALHDCGCDSGRRAIKHLRRRRAHAPRGQLYRRHNPSRTLPSANRIHSIYAQGPLANTTVDVNPGIHHPPVNKKVLSAAGSVMPGRTHGCLLTALARAKAALAIRSQAHRSRYALGQAIDNPDREVKTFLRGWALAVVLRLRERREPRHFRPKFRTLI